MRHPRIRAGTVLLIVAMGASCSDDDAGAPAAEARTEPPTTVAANAAAEDDDGSPTTSQAKTAPPTAPSAAPVEFTACINIGPEVHRGTNERIVVPLSDGEMTILQSRGFTYRQSLTSVSDPRLDGSLHQAWDQDEYTLPGDEAGTGITANRPTGLTIVTFTDRIENDEGAWQGSAVMLNSPDGTTYVGPMVMAGEGAYEGLTAIIGLDGDTFWNGGCTVSGYIIDGSVPPQPVPNTD